VRDRATNAFRGFALVELGTVEAAEHVVRQSLGLREVRACVRACVCVRVCVCERERERETRGGKGRVDG
jgi:hypothetical protein